jgi:uncharacterized tellurite resistance protein B-like protein
MISFDNLKRKVLKRKRIAMGLFDNLLNTVPAEKKYTPEDIREAYSVVLYCCANAEGNVGDEEIIFIDCLFQTMLIFKDYDGAEYLQIAEKAYSNYSAEELLQGSIGFVKESIRPQLFCYCCDIFLADGIVTEEEKKILEKIAELSGIDQETTKKIVEVALIRNVKHE